MLDVATDTGLRSRRFDEGSRYASLHGHTARNKRASRHDPTEAACLERSLAPIYSGRTFSYLEAEMNPDYSAARKSTLLEPYKLTPFELAGRDVRQGLDQDNAWEAVPEMLKELSVTAPTTRKLSDGRTETTYAVKPTMAILPDPTLAKAAEELRTHIYELGRRRRPKLKTVLPTEAPEGVRQKLLQAELHCTGMRVPQTAIVRHNACGSAWRVEFAHGKPLDIDLGVTCKIDAFSTQGRHLPTRTYPHTGWSYEQERWVVEDETFHLDGSESITTRSKCPYRGPWWTVRQEPLRHGSYRSHGSVPCRDSSYHDPQWVGKYELQWRADGGRKWSSLGTFLGNSDETSEVAHCFAHVNKGGLRARYLRVIPLETEGGGAMRVGVYGEAMAARAHARGAGAQAKHGADEDGELIEYKLTEGVPGANRKYVRDGLACRCSSPYSDAEVERMRRREGRQVLHIALDDAASLHRSEACESEPEDEDGVTEGERAPTRRLTLGEKAGWGVAPTAARSEEEEKMRLKEEMRLALAASASLAREEHEELELALALSRSLADDVATVSATVGSEASDMTSEASEEWTAEAEAESSLAEPEEEEDGDWHLV